MRSSMLVARREALWLDGSGGYRAGSGAVASMSAPVSAATTCQPERADPRSRTVAAAASPRASRASAKGLPTRLDLGVHGVDSKSPDGGHHP